MSSSQLPTPAEEYETSTEEQVPIPEWHRKILDERMAKYAATGFQGTTWEEFEKELREEFKELFDS